MPLQKPQGQGTAAPNPRITLLGTFLQSGVYSPVLCPVGSHLLILHAEVGRTLQIHQLRVLHRPDIQILGHQVLASAHGPVHHLGGR